MASSFCSLHTIDAEPCSCAMTRINVVFLFLFQAKTKKFIGTLTRNPEKNPEEKRKGGEKEERRGEKEELKGGEGGEKY